MKKSLEELLEIPLETIRRLFIPKNVQEEFPETISEFSGRVLEKILEKALKEILKEFQEKLLEKLRKLFRGEINGRISIRNSWNSY